MNWTDLLLKNWFVLVILFLIANRFYKRWKIPSNESSQPDKPGKGMPPFGGGGTWSSIPGLSKGTNTVSGNESLQEPRKSAEGHSLKNESVSDFWEDSSISDAHSGESRVSEKRSDQSSGSMNQLFKPTVNQLAQGVIWSEILGPPRSKKPFRK